MGRAIGLGLGLGLALTAACNQPGPSASVGTQTDDGRDTSSPPAWVATPAEGQPEASADESAADPPKSRVQRLADLILRW